MRRPGASRSIGPVKYLAVLLRGGMRCAWCGATIAPRENASVDHLDCDPRNNHRWNLVASCRNCNSARASYWDRSDGWPRWGREAIAEEMVGRWFGASVARRAMDLDGPVVYELARECMDLALERVATQRRKRLPLRRARKLAEQLYAGRLERCREANRRYLERQREAAIDAAERAAIQAA